MRKFRVFLKDRQIKDVIKGDIQEWISLLKSPSPKGEGLTAKTVSRKLTALSNFFSWLVTTKVIQQQANPMPEITNTRVTSPLPEILFEEECKRLLTAANEDPRTYLLLLLLLETGIKLEELFALKVSSFDFQINIARRWMSGMPVKRRGNPGS